MNPVRRAMAKLGDAFTARAPREQGLILLAAVLAVVYLATTQLWWPLMAERRAALDRIGQLDRALAAVARLPPLPTGPADDRPIARIVTETAPDFGLSIRRIDATTQGADLTLDQAGYDGVILWLDALEAEHGLTLSALTLTRRPEPGQVSATLSLRVQR